MGNALKAYMMLTGTSALPFLIVATLGKANTREYVDCPIEEGAVAGQMDDKVMEEASGLAYTRNQIGVLWTQNDHGDEPRVIAINEEGEDIATTVLDGESTILVADTGNNDFDRDPLSIFRFKEPILFGETE